jgi:hypothetical protein
MQLNPLAAALQGIGYGSYLTAVQGLAAADLVLQAARDAQHPQPAFKPRKRVRRLRGPHWVTLAPLHAPAAAQDWQAAEDAESEDEEALMLAGAL